MLAVEIAGSGGVKRVHIVSTSIFEDTYIRAYLKEITAGRTEKHPRLFFMNLRIIRRQNEAELSPSKFVQPSCQIYIVSACRNGVVRAIPLPHHNIVMLSIVVQNDWRV